MLERIRLERSAGPVREQFESDLRALTDAEQDSKELKSAKRQLLFDRIIDTVELPFPVGPSAGEGRRPSSRTRSRRATSRRRQRRSTRSSSAARSPSTSSAPTAASTDEIRPIECEVGVSPRAHGSAPLHPRPDADHVAADARHREGGPADRRPRRSRREALHAPLQLPAVLGRGGRLHARPEAPRHRPRRARRARARADRSRRRRTSRTRSASCRRCSSRTARRRWARSAARRSR